MTIIQVHALMPPEVERVDMCLSAAVEALASALACPSGQVQAQYLPVDAVHEGTRPQRFNGHRPFVQVHATQDVPEPVVRTALTSLANSIAVALDLPIEQVRVQWHPLTSCVVFDAGGIAD